MVGRATKSERDLAAKGGPATGLGSPDGKHNISAFQHLTIQIYKHK